MRRPVSLSTPGEWKWLKLAEVADVVTGNTPSTKEAGNYGDAIPFVKPPELTDSGIQSAPQGLSVKGLSRARRAPVGAVLVSCIGRLGKTGIARVPVAFNQQINAVIFRESVLPEFGFYYAQTLKPWLYGIASATTLPIVNKGKFARAPFPLAPLEQQRRIVAEIEKQFSRLDEAVANLKRVKANLKRYRTAVISAAIGGKSLAGTVCSTPWDWHEIHELAAKESNSITDGPFGSKLKTEHYTVSGPRVIRLQNVGDGVFVDEKAHISPDHFASLSKHRVYPGDLVIAALGETLPRACLVPDTLGPAIVKADCIRFKPGGKVLSRYLMYALNAAQTRRATKARLHGVGRPRLNLGEIKSIVVPVPPLSTQETIVAEVARRLSMADENEAQVEASLRRAEGLRRAILKRAFEGRLG